VPNHPPGADYQGAPLTADRQPENRLCVVVDREGYVVSARLATATDATDFIAVMRDTRDRYPLDPATVVMHGVPCDAEGRGLSVLEMEHHARTARAAA
jgi:hypothetical protein